VGGGSEKGRRGGGGVVGGGKSRRRRKRTGNKFWQYLVQLKIYIYYNSWMLEKFSHMAQRIVLHHCICEKMAIS
jgi:hypothetical protein